MDLPTTFSSTDLMRLERASLLARYDKAPCRPVFAVIRKLENEIACERE
jgi:hypothetical protein